MVINYLIFIKVKTFTFDNHLCDICMLQMHEVNLIMRKIRQTQIEGYSSKYLASNLQKCKFLKVKEIYKNCFRLKDPKETELN